MNKELIYNQYEQLSSKYKDMNIFIEDQIVIIKGKLDFFAEFNGNQIEDSYNIKMIILETYPETIPTIKELDGKINKSFHQFANGDLCLGVRSELYLKFSENKTLLGFVDKLLIPYLYSYSMYLKTKILPAGERSHNIQGILEFYIDGFNVKTKNDVIKILTYIIKGEHYYNHLCPCGSRKRIVDCHRQKMIDYKNKIPLSQLSCDYYQIIKSVNKPRKNVQIFFYLRELIKSIEKDINRRKIAKKQTQI